MGKPFENQEEYLSSILRLASLRLDTLTKPDDLVYCTAARQRADVETHLHRQRCVDTLESGTALPLEYLFSAFELNDFERHCVVLSLTAELDAQYETYFSTVQGGGMGLPTLDTCLRSYTDDQEEQLELLTQWHSRCLWLDYIFRCGHREKDEQAGQGLKLHPRLVDFVLDCDLKDSELTDLIFESWDGAPLPKLVLRQDKLAELEHFTTSAVGERPLLIFLHGAVGSGRRTLARHLCSRLELPLIIVDLCAVLQREEPWETVELTLLREARLRGAALALTGVELLLADHLLPGDDEDGEVTEKWPGREKLRSLLDQASRTLGMLILISQEPWRAELDVQNWNRAELELKTPNAEDRLRLWQEKTEHLPLDRDISLDSLANKFALEPGQITAAVQEALRLQQWQREETISAQTLYQACRRQLPHDLSRLATKVNASYTWEDLILPPEQKMRLEQACDQVEFRRKVYEEWGFGQKVAYGRGVSMLFSGPPGTGKTMAAQVIANRLGLELYKVDLSGVMSKYIGETEKQLGAVFDEVKKSQSILFFDEADALFGKRSETKDSHDRYANVQTSYLLQKIEDYDGIVILASNFLQNFDEAFKRRIKFVIDFTLPDQERREQLWHSVMPQELPRSDDIDFDFLARSFELSGSSIKNIVVSAAFLAASEGTPMNMLHLLIATQEEQHKAGKIMGRDSFGEYYHQIELYQNSRKQQR